jgi:HlyD family secretion protein
MRRSPALLFTLLAAMAVILARSFGSGGLAIDVSYAAVTSGPLLREVLTSGTLEPTRAVDAGTQVSGTIQSLHADFNSVVKAGQVIAQLDPSVYDTKIAQARATLIQAEAEADRLRLLADDAGVKAARARELASADLITAAEEDAAQMTAKGATAELTAGRAAAAAARATVGQAEIDRAKTTLRSPIDGIIVSRNVEVGQTLAASIESPVLFTIASLERMQLLAEVAEADVGGVQPGTEVDFEIESLGAQKFTGKVAEVRLQPVLQEAGSVGATGTSSGAASQPAATTGSSSSSPSPASSPSSPSSSSNASSRGSGTASSSRAGSAPGAANPSQPAQGTPAVPAGSVVSYVAVIDVDNQGNRIAPGNTAVVVLPTARRASAVRIPNTALSFRPAPDVLEAAGQKDLRLPRPGPESDPSQGRTARVWKYEGEKFVPVEVRVGVSDERWTELLSGDLQPGDRLVAEARAR